MTTRYFPMLASPADTTIDRLTGGSWVFEPKYDGIRCISVNGRLFSRSGREITDEFPEITSSPSLTHRVLDGEIVMLDDTGRVSFNKVARRRGSNKAKADDPATFMVFDCIEAGVPNILAGSAFDDRRDFLTSIEHQLGSNTLLVPQFADGQIAWSTCMSFGQEGVIAKKWSSTYVSGRSKAWLKFKKEQTISAVVVGTEEGSGHRSATFGALMLALNDGTDVVQIGSVGSGFTKDDEQAIHDRMVKNQQLIEAGKQPDLIVVEVKFMEFTTPSQNTKERKQFPIGKLRFPVFLGVRDDIAPLDCTTDQLEAK